MRGFVLRVLAHVRTWATWQNEKCIVSDLLFDVESGALRCTNRKMPSLIRLGIFYFQIPNAFIQCHPRGARMTSLCSLRAPYSCGFRLSLCNTIAYHLGFSHRISSLIIYGEVYVINFLISPIKAIVKCF